MIHNRISKFNTDREIPRLKDEKKKKIAAENLKKVQRTMDINNIKEGTVQRKLQR